MSEQDIIVEISEELLDRAEDLEAAFFNHDTVFITEDVIEALQILQAGGNGVAVGVNGEDAIKEFPGPLPENVYIITGPTEFEQDIANHFKSACKSRSRDAVILHLPEQYNDLKEFFVDDEKLLRTLLQGGNCAEWERMTKATRRIDDFLQDVQTNRYKPIKTGFNEFDRITQGGLVRQSLVMLAAAPGQGKTTLASQLFEGMAKQGQQVIYVNLEMSHEQLIAKSLTRHAYRMGYGDFSASDVMRGYSWTQDQEQAIKKAALDYKRDIAINFIFADRNETSARLDDIMEYLRAAARQAKRIGQEAPLVVIDYLHIIQTTDGRGHDEDQAQAIKRSVIELKEFAIEFNTIVFAILATNRESNRGKELTLYSGRDTSNIEYSADMFLTLQEAENEPAPQESQALMLRVEKNRMGEVGKATTLYFDGKHGLFTEAWLPKDSEIQRGGRITI